MSGSSAYTLRSEIRTRDAWQTLTENGRYQAIHQLRAAAEDLGTKACVSGVNVFGAKWTGPDVALPRRKL
jgi:uncharacterized protein YbjQ (UPF0145 family)